MVTNDEELKPLPTDQSGKKNELRNLDDFVHLGRYCFLVLVASEFMTLTQLTNMVFMVYAGIAPSVLSFNGNSYVNLTDRQACIQYEKDLSVLLSSKATEIPKPEMTYQFNSVNIEFDMICSKGLQVKNSISTQMLGVLVGALFAGAASDHYGRRFILIIALVGSSLFSFVQAYAQTFTHFIIARTLIGLFTGGLSAVQGVYLIENIPKAHRLWINTLVTWSPNFVIFPIIAYFCGNWRTLATFGGWIAAAALVSMLILEESPRWRIHKGQIDRARKSLYRIVKIDGNKEEELEEIEDLLEHEREQYALKQLKTESHQLTRLLKSGKHMIWTATVCYGIMTTSFINYGLLFNMEKLSGSLYWNNFIFGIIRWIFNIEAGAADYFFDWVGRKTINLSAMIVIIPSLAVIVSILYTGTQMEYAWIIRYITLGVTAMTSQLYLAKLMIASELFPTSVRNMVISFLSVSSRMGTIIAPQLFYLGEFSPNFPYVFLLIVSLVDAIAFQTLLPETKGRNLENSLPEKAQKNILSRRQSIAEA